MSTVTITSNPFIKVIEIYNLNINIAVQLNVMWPQYLTLYSIMNIYLQPQVTITIEKNGMVHLSILNNLIPKSSKGNMPCQMPWYVWQMWPASRRCSLLEHLISLSFEGSHMSWQELIHWFWLCYWFYLCLLDFMNNSCWILEFIFWIYKPFRPPQVFSIQYHQQN